MSAPQGAAVPYTFPVNDDSTGTFRKFNILPQQSGHKMSFISSASTSRYFKDFTGQCSPSPQPLSPYPEPTRTSLASSLERALLQFLGLFVHFAKRIKHAFWLTQPLCFALNT